MWLRFAALAALILPGSAHALELWLASFEGCADCALYERAAQQRGYGWALERPEQGGLTIPILRIGKGVLASDILSQLPEDVGPSSASWERALTVLVVDVDRVVFAGNIAESADTSQLRQPQTAMFPPAAPPERDPSLRRANLEAEFSAAQWNLEYFVDVALGKQPRRIARPLVDLAAPEVAALGARNVVLWGSAARPLESSEAVAARLAEVRDALGALDALGPNAVRYSLLYGHGPGVEGNDTSYVADGRTLFKRADIGATHAADAASLNGVLTAVRWTPRARTLLVHAGHMDVTGAPLWGSGAKLAPADLAPLATEPAGELVVVSGSCHGGQLAPIAQCGFFAAHPDALAASCELSPVTLAQSDDYLRHFFRAATGEEPVAGSGTGARRRGSAPTLPTLHDAHWHASSRLEDHALTYTTTDALVDAYFASRPSALPPSLMVADLRAAAPALPRAEAQAVAALTAGLPADLAIPLEGHVEMHREAAAKLDDARDASLNERNALSGLPYKLTLVLLARRIAYAASEVQDAAFTAAVACEQRSLVDVLGSSARR
jgi:hypothetical protein